MVICGEAGRDLMILLKREEKLPMITTSVAVDREYTLYHPVTYKHGLTLVCRA